MKKKIIGLLLGIMVLFPSIVLADDTKDELVPGFTESEESYFKAGDDVTSNIMVNHNYFIAGNSVTSNDYVNGLLFAAGNDVKVGGITNYIFAAGNTISIEGVNYNDMFLAGNEIKVGSDSQVARDLYAAGSTITINTRVNGNIFAAAGTIDLSNAVVTGNVNVFANQITINDNTQILGSINYNSNAVVNGNLNNICSNISTYNVSSDSESVSYKSIIVDSVVSYLSLLVIGLLIIVFVPSVYNNINVKTSFKEYIIKFCKGFGFLIILPLAALILLFTTIGMPLAIISLLLYGIMIYLSFAMSGLVLGKVLFKNLKVKTNKYLEFAAGLLIVKLLMLIPYVGDIFVFIFLLIGLWYIVEEFIPKKN